MRFAHIVHGLSAWARRSLTAERLQLDVRVGTMKP
jgi:hypothetical protein